MYVIFFVKQKTAYEMLISDWSSDVCSSDLPSAREIPAHPLFEERLPRSVGKPVGPFNLSGAGVDQSRFDSGLCISAEKRIVEAAIGARARSAGHRSEEHTSELQSLMRISYAVFCLKKTNDQLPHTTASLMEPETES